MHTFKIWSSLERSSSSGCGCGAAPMRRALALLISTAPLPSSETSESAQSFRRQGPADE